MSLWPFWIPFLVSNIQLFVTGGSNDILSNTGNVQHRVVT